MTAPVYYTHPLVPPEWIEAHGLPAARLFAASQGAGAAAAGVCPAAVAIAAAASDAARRGPVIASSACDQLRRSLESATSHERLFVLNVPATWQTPAASSLFRDGLLRMSAFLQRHGGRPPLPARLMAAIRDRQERMDDLRRLLADAGDDRRHRLLRAFWRGIPACSPPAMADAPASDALRIGLLGCLPPDRGDLLRSRFRAANLTVAAEGLDDGERVLPPAPDRERLERDPLSELIRMYIGPIPLVSQRPNTPLHAWVRSATSSASLHGWLLVRQPGCDLWSAEVPRLRQSGGVPLLELETGPQVADHRLATRIEAFAEALAANRGVRPERTP